MEGQIMILGGIVRGVASVWCGRVAGQAGAGRGVSRPIRGGR